MKQPASMGKKSPPKKAGAAVGPRQKDFGGKPMTAGHSKVPPKRG